MTKVALDTPEQNKEQGVYSKPQLIEYGKVEEITQGGASGPSTDYGNQRKFMG
jgi:hypothetical protein